MARAGAESKALILLLTFFPQCVLSMLSMTPPVMASHIAFSLGLSPKIAGVYVGLVYAGAILSSSFSASLITRLGPLRTSCVCVVTGGAGLALLAVPHLRRLLVGDRHHRTELRPADAGEFTRAGALPQRRGHGLPGFGAPDQRADGRRTRRLRRAAARSRVGLERRLRFHWRSNRRARGSCLDRSVRGSQRATG